MRFSRYVDNLDAEVLDNLLKRVSAGVLLVRTSINAKLPSSAIVDRILSNSVRHNVRTTVILIHLYINLVEEGIVGLVTRRASLVVLYRPASRCNHVKHAL